MELGWIDFTEEERKNTLSVLSALKEATAVDEIGIGVVRDAFADKFFPGTSTLLRRTKYFFLVAYALANMEAEGNKGKSSSALRRDYDDIERRIGEKLLEQDSGWGIIGQRALRSGSWVTRGPGEIYWAPLRTYGVFVHPTMSYFDYFAALAGMPTQQRAAVNTYIGASDDEAPIGSFWHIPRDSWDGWRDNITATLTKDEALFLKNQILSRCSDSLMAEIIQNDELREHALSIFAYVPEDDEAIIDADSIFNQFFKSAQHLLQHRPDLLRQCSAATMFSKFVYACRIRYNIQIPDSTELAEQEWAAFKDEAYENAVALDIENVYRQSGATSVTGLKLHDFLVGAKKCLMRGDNGVAELDSLVRARERDIKRNKAKIGRVGLDNVSWRGGRYLPYRFANGMRIIAEIDEAGGFDA